MATLRAVVTGASSGIGAATVRRLTASGWHVTAVARRTEKLAALADETGCTVTTADLTSADDVAAMAEQVIAAGPVHALIANAGAAYGHAEIADAAVTDWQKTMDINAFGLLRSINALLPALTASGRGDVLIMGSTAGLVTYEAAGAYTASKHAVHAIAQTLRLELAGSPVRVMEITPGMVKTDEFNRKRFGSQEAADKIYEGVENPLTAEDIADAVDWMLSRPHHVNVDLMVIRPIAQAAQHKVARHQGL